MFHGGDTLRSVLTLSHFNIPCRQLREKSLHMFISDGPCFPSLSSDTHSLSLQDLSLVYCLSVMAVGPCHDTAQVRSV